MRLEDAGHPERVGEMPGQVGALHREDPHHQDHRRRDHHHERAQRGVGALVADEPGRDPLVDDVGLLEEQLPGATVVPTIAMMSSTAVEFAPPCMPGTTKW